MPKSKPAIIPQIQADEQEPVHVEHVEHKRTRKMTPEALEKLRLAREKAVEARKKSGQVNRELIEIRKDLREQKLGDRVDEVETYHKLKAKVEDEVKANEIVSINKKLEDMYTRFDGFLHDRERRKQEKALRKQEKTARQMVQELPAVVNKQLLEEELKKQELLRFRKNVFGF